MANFETENYFDQWERRDQGRYLNDPRDFLPEGQRDYSNLVIYDVEGFRQLLGEEADSIIAQAQVMQPNEEIILAAA